MAQEVNLSAVRGDTYKVNVTFTDENNAPIDITGSTVTMTIKNGGISSIQKVNGPSDHLNATVGMTQIVVLPQDWPNVLPCPQGDVTARYDIQIIQANGDVSTVVYGNFTIIRDYTQ